jgi:hypothetical protein
MRSQKIRRNAKTRGFTDQKGEREKKEKEKKREKGR